MGFDPLGICSGGIVPVVFFHGAFLLGVPTAVLIFRFDVFQAFRHF